MTMTKEQRLARVVRDTGLTFADTVSWFAKQPDQAALQSYRDKAYDLQRDGEIEIDSNAIVSPGDDAGAYVMAWVWVPDDE